MAVAAAKETDQNSGRTEWSSRKTWLVSLQLGRTNRILRRAGLLWRFFRNSGEAGRSCALGFIAGQEIFWVKMGLRLREEDVSQELIIVSKKKTTFY